jgi:hypothetical protein
VTADPETFGFFRPGIQTDMLTLVLQPPPTARTRFTPISFFAARTPAWRRVWSSSAKTSMRRPPALPSWLTISTAAVTAFTMPDP